MSQKPYLRFMYMIPLLVSVFVNRYYFIIFPFCLFSFFITIR